MFEKLIMSGMVIAAGMFVVAWFAENGFEDKRDRPDWVPFIGGLSIIIFTALVGLLAIVMIWA